MNRLTLSLLSSLCVGLLGSGLLVACGEEEQPPDGGGGSPGEAGAPGQGGEGGAPPSELESCPEPTGPGTEHEGWRIDADEVWTAAGSPHYIRRNTSIRGATVTIEKCAVVLLAEGVSLEVGDSVGEPSALIAEGQLDAEGELPVVFAPAEEGAYWASIVVASTGTLALEGTILVGGGTVDTPQTNGVIVSRAFLELPVRHNVHLRNVGVVDAQGIGVHLGLYTAFTEESDNVYFERVGNAEPVYAAVDTRYPVRITPSAFTTLPDMRFESNGVDGVRVDGRSRYPESATIRAVGAPYYPEGDIYFGAASIDEATATTVTIEAGVEFRFSKPDSGTRYRFLLGAESDGERPVRLVARGTTENPIIFTSAEGTPAPGDWTGIVWMSGPPTGNVFDHVVVGYAGGESLANSHSCGARDDDGAFLILGWRPAEAFITNSVFAYSATQGIVSGWDSDEEGPNLRGNNEFVDIAGVCEVAQPFVDGRCPGEDDEPDCF